MFNFNSASIRLQLDWSDLVCCDVLLSKWECNCIHFNRVLNLESLMIVIFPCQHKETDSIDFN